MGKKSRNFLKYLFILVFIVLGFGLIKNLALNGSDIHRYEPAGLAYAATRLNVRESPSTDSKVKETLDFNERVMIYDTLENKFNLILNNDSTVRGWVYASYLSNQKAIISEPPTIDILNVKLEEKNIIKITIEHTLPMPIEIMISATAKDVLPKETAIGRSIRVKLEDTKRTYYIYTTYNNAFDRGEGLPTGTYIISAKYYKDWGWKDGNPLAKGITTDIEVSSEFELITQYGTVEERRERDKKQLWIMENISQNKFFELDKYKEILGSFSQKKMPVLNGKSVVTCFYFDEADMTIFRYDLRNETAGWRPGNKSSFD